jgi:hypothetical protein
VQLGALTALALAVAGCNTSSADDDDDDDCALGPTGGGTVALAMHAPTVTAGSTRTEPRPTATLVPERGGFGTHLASCGG